LLDTGAGRLLSDPWEALRSLAAST
jgi:hypothetical protein